MNNNANQIQGTKPDLWDVESPYKCERAQRHVEHVRGCWPLCSWTALDVAIVALARNVAAVSASTPLHDGLGLPWRTAQTYSQ